MTTPSERNDLTVDQGVDSGPPVDEPVTDGPAGHGNGELLAGGGDDHAGPGQELDAGEG